MGKLSEKNARILKTCNLYFCFFTLGMSIAVAGPCLLDLKHVVNTDMQHIALMYTTRSTGVILGAICGGILLDFIKSEMAVLAICKLLVAVTMLGIPWCRNFESLLGFMIVNGISIGTIELGCNVVCLTLWGEKSGPIFLHFTFGLGGFVAPLIAAPFLGDYIESDAHQATYSDDYLNETLWNTTSSSLTNSTVIRESKIAYPFIAIGICGLVVSSMFAFICFSSPAEQSKIDNEKETKSNRSLVFTVTVVTLNFLLIFTQAGTEIGYGQMLTTYAVKGRLRVTATTGSYMTSAFWASFMTSRLASVFLAARFSSLTIIIGDMITITVAALILLFLMPREWVLWTASVIYGAGVASFYPTTIGWVNTQLLVTNKIASIFTVGAAIGEVVPFIISFLIESVPEIFTYVVAGSCVSAYLLVFIMHMIFRHSGSDDIPTDSDKFRMRAISITA